MAAWTLGRTDALCARYDPSVAITAAPDDWTVEEDDWPVDAEACVVGTELGVAEAASGWGFLP
jgi:hypothetical protein